MVDLKDSYYTLRAVQSDEESIIGILRMSGHDTLRRTNIIGLHGLFEIVQPQEEVLFYNEALFFYGHSWDLSQNYVREIPETLRENYQMYRDRQMNNKNLETKYTILKYGYMSIPFNQLRLDRNHGDLVSQLLAETEKRGLLLAVEYFSRVDLPKEERIQKCYLAQHLSSVPKAFEERIKAAGYYYKTDRTVAKRGTELLLATSVRSVRTVSGVPSWAENYVGPFIERDIEKPRSTMPAFAAL